jgi:hypothetical protein
MGFSCASASRCECKWAQPNSSQLAGCSHSFCPGRKDFMFRRLEKSCRWSDNKRSLTNSPLYLGSPFWVAARGVITPEDVAGCVWLGNVPTSQVS